MSAILLVLYFSIFIFIPFARATADYAQGEVRMKIDLDVPEKGTLEYFEYLKEGKYTYTCRVYLPYGYRQNDKSKAYDVLLIMPGASGSMHTYLDTPYDGCTGAQILDDLFYYHYAQPSIVVTISSFKSMGVGVDFMMIDQIRALIQAIDEKYNTYGNPDMNVILPEGEELRDHYVLAGFCYCADVMVSVLIESCNDLFSRYGIFSTVINTSDPLIEELKKSNEEHSIKAVMISSGNYEFRFEYYTEQLGDCLDSMGIPVYRFSYTAVDHGYERNAMASLYNIVQLMFPSHERSAETDSASFSSLLSGLVCAIRLSSCD